MYFSNVVVVENVFSFLLSTGFACHFCCLFESYTHKCDYIRISSTFFPMKSLFANSWILWKAYMRQTVVSNHSKKIYCSQGIYDEILHTIHPKLDYFSFAIFSGFRADCERSFFLHFYRLQSLTIALLWIVGACDK